MIRNKSLGKRLLAAGIMLIFSMSGCGTDNKIELTGNGIGSDGIEAAATVDSAEVGNGIGCHGWRCCIHRNCGGYE